MNTFKTKPIGQIVADDYRTSKIFRKHEIDFCCKGNKTLLDVNQERKILLDEIIGELESLLTTKDNAQTQYQLWTSKELIQHILDIHHHYVRSHLEMISEYLDKVCLVHGHSHPELHEVADHFYITGENLLAHMQKEESILFPYIIQLEDSKKSNISLAPPPFGTVQNPINMMLHEHEAEGNRFRKIAELTSNYMPPEEACNTYRVLYSLLNEFEQDLHTHIHLENNILFPKALALANHA